MINIGNYRELFLKLFCMEFKLRKCFFLRKFNDKKIISLRPRMSFDGQKIFSWCGRCGGSPCGRNPQHQMWEKSCVGGMHSCVWGILINFLFCKNLVWEESCGKNPVGGTCVGGITCGRNSVGGILCGRNPSWEESSVGGILCGRNPVWEESCGRNPVGGILHGRNPVGEETHAWAESHGRDPTWEESRWNRKF